jgi:ribosome maturation factor RimP
VTDIDLDRIKALIEPAVTGEGCLLWDIEMTGGHGNSILRVYIDKEGGVKVEDCAKVSRQASLILDTEDVIKDRYVLEVSSPGLTRPLKNPKDFQRALGKLALLKLRKPVGGFSKILVTIEEADAESVIVTFKKTGLRETIPYVDIAKANLEIEF